MLGRCLARTRIGGSARGTTPLLRERRGRRGERWRRQRRIVERLSGHAAPEGTCEGRPGWARSAHQRATGSMSWFSRLFDRRDTRDGELRKIEIRKRRLGPPLVRNQAPGPPSERRGAVTPGCAMTPTLDSPMAGPSRQPRPRAARYARTPHAASRTRLVYSRLIGNGRWPGPPRRSGGGM